MLTVRSEEDAWRAASDNVLYHTPLHFGVSAHLFANIVSQHCLSRGLCGCTDKQPFLTSARVLTFVSRTFSALQVIHTPFN